MTRNHAPGEEAAKRPRGGGVLGWLRRNVPRPSDLRGSFLHTWLGERLFDRRLWTPDRQSLALGLALGSLIGLLPTLGGQTILGVSLAFIFRVNIPASVFGTVATTNPVTIPFVYGFEYKLGVWLLDKPAPDFESYTDAIANWDVYFRPLMVGSTVVACIGAIGAWMLVQLLWASVGKALGRFLHPSQDAEDELPPNSDVA